MTALDDDDRSVRPLRLALVCAERSGDLLGSRLLMALRSRWPDLQAQGIGGPAMQAQGMQARWSCDALSVRGLVEALARLRSITGIRRTLLAQLQAQPPDAFIGIDASDFNLPLQQALRAQGVPTVQLVCPSIWAWRPERVHRIRRSIDHVLCLYPFEPALLAAHGIEATFIGHPVADMIPAVPDRFGARERLGLPQDAQVVAVLPGSRPSEIRHLAQPFMQAVAQLHRERPQLRFVLPTHAPLMPTLQALRSALGLEAVLQLVSGQSHEVMAACDVAMVASGTATLETALHKRPMVIAYKMQWLSWQLANRRRLVRWIGLPNILCDAGLVPELLQDQVRPEALVREVLAWLDDPARVQALRERFDQLHQELRRDSAALTVHAIDTLLQRRAGSA